MSIKFYLACMDHDPPLRADDCSGQHHSDLPQIRMDIEMREPLLRTRDEMAEWGGWYDLGSSDRNSTLRFFENHRTCNLGILDEYGEWHATTEEEETDSDADAGLLHGWGFFERRKRWVGVVGRRIHALLGERSRHD